MAKGKSTLAAVLEQLTAVQQDMARFRIVILEMRADIAQVRASRAGFMTQGELLSQCKELASFRERITSHTRLSYL